MTMANAQRASLSILKNVPLRPTTLLILFPAFFFMTMLCTLCLCRVGPPQPQAEAFSSTSRFQSWLWLTPHASKLQLMAGPPASLSKKPLSPALTVLNAECPDKPKTVIQLRDSNDLPFHRSILATIPRSGNHLMRYLLEATTKVQTETTQAERRSADWRWMSQAFGGCPLDPAYGCENSEIHRAKGTDSVVVKSHFPFHGPSPVWGESQVHIDSIVTTIRDPFENYLSWLFYKCANQPTREMYTFHHYLTEWLDFHLFYREYARGTCTKLLEIRYEALADQKVRADTLGAIVERLKFPDVDSADLDEAAAAYNMTLSPAAERLALAPGVLCSAFRPDEVEKEPGEWAVFKESDNSRLELIVDYNLSYFQNTFRRNYESICRPQTPAHAQTHVSCSDLNALLKQRNAASMSNPRS